MGTEDLTLDEMFALEKEHPPLVGSRTSVFLEPLERATAQACIEELYGKVAAKGASGAKTKQHAREQVALKLAAVKSISTQEASDILEAIEKLAKAND
jgi:hypothetical protein